MASEENYAPLTPAEIKEALARFAQGRCRRPPGEAAPAREGPTAKGGLPPQLEAAMSTPLEKLLAHMLLVDLPGSTSLDDLKAGSAAP